MKELEKLAQAVAKEFEVKITTTHKPNEEVRGLSVSQFGSNIGLFIPESRIPEDFDEALSFIKAIASTNKPEFTLGDIEQDLKRDLHNVRPRVVKYEGNEAIVNEFVGRKFLDLYVYYYIPANNWITDEKNHLTVNITKAMADLVPVLEEDLFTVALKNLKKDADTDALFGVMPIVSNKDRYFGAAQILNTSIFREYEMDLLIIPSSINELIIMPKKFIPKDVLKEMIRDVNKSSVLPQEVLSDHPYYYNYAKDCIEM